MRRALSVRPFRFAAPTARRLAVRHAGQLRPGTCGRAPDTPGTRAPRPCACTSARSTPWSACITSRSTWTAAGSTASASPIPRSSGASSTRTPTCGPLRGGMCTRSSTRSAAMFACSRPLRPERNSCRRATATQSTRGRRRTGSSSLHPDGRIDTEVRWVDRNRRCASRWPRPSTALDPCTRARAGRPRLLAACAGRCAAGARRAVRSQRRRRAALALGAARQAQHRVPARFHSCAASERLSARAGGAWTPTATPSRCSWKSISTRSIRRKCSREMLASALLPEGKTLPEIMGPAATRARRAWPANRGGLVDVRASSHRGSPPRRSPSCNSRSSGSTRNRASKCIFMERARADGKSVAGLETVHDQMALFESHVDGRPGRILDVEPRAGSRSAQAGRRHGARMAARRHGVVRIRDEIRLGQRSRRYISRWWSARNRKWIAKIEALLDDDKNYLVIVGTAHLVGQDSVIELLKKDGIRAAQR